MLHPGKKRNSKCRRPWLLKESAKVHDRTLRKACGSWDDMICSGIVQNNEIPPTIRIAASKICHDFVTSPSAKKTNEEEAIIHQGQSHRRRTRRRSEPPPRYTPKERKNKVKKREERPQMFMTTTNNHPRLPHSKIQELLLAAL